MQSPERSPFTIEELESGLRMLGRPDLDQKAFWDEHILGFRQTVLLAIRETSEALLSPTISLQWRGELESQLEALIVYLKLAEAYTAPESHQLPAQRFPRSKIH